MDGTDSDDVTTLPRGHHNLSRDEVRAAQRGRLLMGITAAVAEKSYAATTIADVLKRARISRETFYQHFSSKQSCFLAAFDEAANLLIAEMEKALGPATDPVLARLDQVLSAYLDVLAAAPVLARSFLIEVHAAGHEAVARRIAVQERFAVAIADVISHGQGLRGGLDTQFVGRAVIGMVSSLVTAHLESGEYARLSELREQIMRLVSALLESPETG